MRREMVWARENGNREGLAHMTRGWAARPCLQGTWCVPLEKASRQSSFPHESGVLM